MSVGLTIAACERTDPHAHHVWTPEPRVINGPKRCPGVRSATSPVSQPTSERRQEWREGTHGRCRSNRDVACDLCATILALLDALDAADARLHRALNGASPSAVETADFQNAAPLPGYDEAWRP